MSNTDALDGGCGVPVVRAAVLGFQEIHEKCIDLLKGDDDLSLTGEVSP